ncbi:ethylene-responsive transcription factor ERF017 isoform X2 [Fagus crenata]
MVKQTIEKPTAATTREEQQRNDAKYTGVRKRKWGKWVSEIRLPNSRERIWLGSYDSAVKAARAFDAALFCLRGRTAKFNFPDNPPEIPGGRSLKPTEIQAAAARFANSDAPQSVENSDRMEMMNNSSSSSPSPSVSEGTVETVPTERDSTNLDESFLDLFNTMGSGNYGSDYGIFPGFDDLTDGLFTQPLPTVDYGEEIFDEVLNQDACSFLWNF